MKELASKTKWDKENTVLVTMRLMKKSDADILAAIQDKPTQPTLKRLIRIGLAHDKEEQ